VATDIAKSEAADSSATSSTAIAKYSRFHPRELVEGSRENYEENLRFSLSVLFVPLPHSSQVYETSTRSGVKAIDVACTNRISNLQVGQLGDAGTEPEPTSDEDDT
jgi:hypothetical protein